MSEGELARQRSTTTELVLERGQGLREHGAVARLDDLALERLAAAYEDLQGLAASMREGQDGAGCRAQEM